MEVLKLQQFLFAENYLKITPSGFFGTDTVKAVKSFQKANGITQVGSAGSLTRKKIKELTCSNSSIKVDKISLSTPAGRQALYDILLTRDAKSILTLWDNGMMLRNNPDEVSTIAPALGSVLRGHGDPKIYTEISKRLNDSSRNLQERLAFLTVLDTAATKESVKIIIAFAQSMEEKNLKETLKGDDVELLESSQRSIGEASRTLIDGARNWNVSPALEEGWINFESNQFLKTRSVIVNSIVYVGKPEGLTVIINSIKKDNLSKEARSIALSAISGLSSNDATPILALALKDSITDIKYSTELVDALIRGLVSADTADSTYQLLNYIDLLSGTQKDLTQKKIKDLLAASKQPNEVLKVMKGTVLESK